MNALILKALQTRPKVTREELVSMTGLTDRKVRREIESMRRDGVPICSSLDGGYSLAKSPYELEEFLDRYTRTAKKILSTGGKMKRGIRKGAQYELPM